MAPILSSHSPASCLPASRSRAEAGHAVGVGERRVVAARSRGRFATADQRQALGIAPNH